MCSLCGKSAKVRAQWNKINIEWWNVNKWNANAVKDFAWKHLPPVSFLLLFFIFFFFFIFENKQIGPVLGLGLIFYLNLMGRMVCVCCSKFSYANDSMSCSINWVSMISDAQAEAQHRLLEITMIIGKIHDMLQQLSETSPESGKETTLCTL